MILDFQTLIVCYALVRVMQAAGLVYVWQVHRKYAPLRELAAGTLAQERFRFFLEQDMFFLPELARAVGLGLAKAGDERELRQCDAGEGIVVPELETEPHVRRSYS